MYDEIFNYTDSNFTIAYKNGKAGLIDTNTGKPITEFVYDIMENNLPRCVKGYKDHKVFEDELDFFFAMHAGINKDYCTMSKNNKWGLLNKKGEVVFDFKYKYPIKLLGILCRISGYYIANVEGHEGVIDKNSNIILEPIYDHIMESENYWSCEKDNLFGLADINGKMVADIKYDNAFGIATQIGADFNITDNFFLNVDAKYIFLKTDVTVDATNLASGLTIPADVKINPLLLGFGVGYRF